MGTHPIFESDFDCLTDLKKHGSFTLQLPNRPGDVFHNRLFSHDCWTRFVCLLFRRASDEIEKCEIAFKGLFFGADLCRFHGSWNDVHHAHCWNLRLDLFLSSRSSKKKKCNSKLIHKKNSVPSCRSPRDTILENK